MNELEKLKHLLYHWREHNDEHADTYRDWSEKALALGNKELAAVLGRLCDETKKINGLFDEARKTIKSV